MEIINFITSYMSKRIISTIIGLVTVLLSGTMSLFAQQTPGNISGKVVDSDGMPLAGVVVMAKGNNANAATTDVTVISPSRFRPVQKPSCSPASVWRLRKWSSAAELSSTSRWP